MYKANTWDSQAWNTVSRLEQGQELGNYWSYLYREKPLRLHKLRINHWEQKSILSLFFNDLEFYLYIIQEKTAIYTFYLFPANGTTLAPCHRDNCSGLLLSELVYQATQGVHVNASPFSAESQNSWHPYTWARTGDWTNDSSFHLFRLTV